MFFTSFQNTVSVLTSRWHLTSTAKKTNMFLDIPGVVAMIDGFNMEMKDPGNHVLQNRDYNRWTKDVIRNMVLTWDPLGKIVDAAINLTGNFLNSKSTWWCNSYKHLEAFQPLYKCVCDDAFYTSGQMAENCRRPKKGSLKVQPDLPMIGV